MADRLLPASRLRVPTIRRSGFTILELVVAGVVAAIIVGALTLSLSQLGRSRNATMIRLEAHMRANAALDALRRDIASVLRSGDLFETRLLIIDGSVGSLVGPLDRDELLLFSSRIAPVRPNRYQGEGSEYETQYRVEEDRLGAALWQRRDPIPDRWPDAGGVATPMVDGIVELNLEGYDGEAWFPDWDSDLHGLPWAIRITVTAIGNPVGDERSIEGRSLVTLRTVVAVDRIIPPPTEEEIAKAEEEAVTAEEEAAGAAGGAVPGAVVVPGDPSAGGGGAGGGGGGGGRGPGGGGGGAMPGGPIGSPGGGGAAPGGGGGRGSAGGGGGQVSRGSRGGGPTAVPGGPR